MASAHPTIPGVTFKGIEGFPGYCIGDDGSVFSSKTRKGSLTGNQGWRDNGPWRRLAASKDNDGYLTVILCCNGKCNPRKVHRLVLETFVGLCPEDMECLHADGDPSNNRLSNLSWGTRKRNGEDKVRHGRSVVGSKHGQAKLTEKQVSEIKSLYRSGRFFQRELADMYGVYQTNISLIVRGEKWKHVP